jgi:hypothetical protein
MRSFVRFTMAIAVLAPVTAFTATPAGAASGTVCAKQTGTATINPGITPKATNVTISIRETLSGCKGGGVTSGTEVATMLSKATTCNGLARIGTKAGPFTGRITWSNKKTSTVSLSTVSNGLNAAVSGTVKSGLFAGQKITTSIQYSLSQGTCNTTPLTALGIKGTKPFVI